VISQLFIGGAYFVIFMPKSALQSPVSTDKKRPVKVKISRTYMYIFILAELKMPLRDV
jgi:hypothetical protein